MRRVREASAWVAAVLWAVTLFGLALATPAAARAAACEADGWTAAVQANAASVTTSAWAPFGRAEAGWQVYAPRIARDIGSDCRPDSAGFAAALAGWQAAHGLPADGIVSEGLLIAFKGGWQADRPFVALTASGVCPETADVIAAVRPDEGLDGKLVWLHPKALAAFRSLRAAARAEIPGAAEDPEFLGLFSGYRSPTLDAQRCLADGACDGVARARCSSHRTGYALDLYLGHAEGFSADSTADSNRLYLSRTAAYRWLVANAGRFGFVNYAFEPWHWEWTGPAPRP